MNIHEHERLNLARYWGPLHKHATTPIPKEPGLDEVHGKSPTFPRLRRTPPKPPPPLYVVPKKKQSSTIPHSPAHCRPYFVLRLLQPSTFGTRTFSYELSPAAGEHHHLAQTDDHMSRRPGGDTPLWKARAAPSASIRPSLAVPDWPRRPTSRVCPQFTAPSLRRTVRARLA